MNSSRCLVSVMAFALTAFQPIDAAAHCDTLDGPVVKAAIAALDHRDVALALVWVQPEGEAEVRAAFTRTLAVRGLSADAQSLADRYFFETLVRVHRAGEGAPFTGLKPAGEDPGPAIAAADRAVQEGGIKPLATLFTTELMAVLHRHFEEVAAARNYDPNDLTAGRRFVKAYVEYVHFVERLHEAIVTAPNGHFAETPPR